MDFQEDKQGHRGKAWRRVAAGAYQLFVVLGEGFAEERIGGMGEHGVGEVVEGL